MNHKEKEIFKARKQWYKDNPGWEQHMHISEWVYCVDKFYSCDGDKLELLLIQGIGDIRPRDLFPEDQRSLIEPMVRLISCDDAALTRTFKVGEEKEAREVFDKIIDMQPISFAELKKLGFIFD